MELCMRNKNFISLMLLIFMSGCQNVGAVKPVAQTTPVSTEIPCPGVKPMGVVTGMQAYITLNGPVVSAGLFDTPQAELASEKVSHHIRVKVDDGPVCADSSSWWKVSLEEGLTGWLQVGSALEADGITYEAILEPYLDDAVQREVPEERSKEAQVRYIVADIELGGEDVLQYYKDQVAAKPDDAETEIIRNAISIINAGNGDPVLANGEAFERIPLRGGTSIVDAGTEYVQPGLDILLVPCDGKKPPDPVCDVLIK